MKKLPKADKKKNHTIRYSDNEEALFRKVSDQPAVFLREVGVREAEYLVSKGLQWGQEWE